MTYAFGETVQILDGAATGEDSYGNDVSTWPVKATYADVPLAPATGDEQTQSQDLVVVGLTAYLPADADVAAVDRVIARGDTWEVTGLPQAWQSPYTGWRPGMVVALRRVTG